MAKGPSGIIVDQQSNRVVGTYQLIFNMWLFFADVEPLKTLIEVVRTTPGWRNSWHAAFDFFAAHGYSLIPDGELPSEDSLSKEMESLDDDFLASPSGGRYYILRYADEVLVAQIIGPRVISSIDEKFDALMQKIEDEGIEVYSDEVTETPDGDVQAQLKVEKVDVRRAIFADFARYLTLQGYEIVPPYFVESTGTFERPKE